MENLLGFIEGLAENYKTSQSADEEKSEDAKTESAETDTTEKSAE